MSSSSSSSSSSSTAHSHLNQSHYDVSYNAEPNRLNDLPSRSPMLSSSGTVASKADSSQHRSSNRISSNLQSSGHLISFPSTHHDNFSHSHRPPSPPLIVSTSTTPSKRTSTPMLPTHAYNIPRPRVASTARSTSPLPPSKNTEIQAPQRSLSQQSNHTAPANRLLGYYQLGDCLGRGAFGSVFRGLNWLTGETVAVKQVQLGNIPKSELGEIMSEIDLLKNLNHPNIVKYKGSEKTKDYLYIILEYCENGSLHNICKRFGKFPEGLVGVYISQVLQGLLYLHDQGVIHRDIKGANILTTKDGSVKLADFGVATKTGAMSDYAVVGSPYWMAPEVIDQSGATTASDIWSVGCVVVELLQGKPPYHYLAPMPALFRIVQDDCPPLPEGASPMVKDFLLHCFQKDANLRVSARKLLKHAWMTNARKQLQHMKTGGAASLTVHDEAVKSVQQWNQALKEPPKPLPNRANDLSTVRASNQPALRRISGSITDASTARPGLRKARVALRPTLPIDFSQQMVGHSNDATIKHIPKISAMPAPAPPETLAKEHAHPSSSKLQLGGAAPATSLFDQRNKLANLQNPEEATDNWDDDFEEDITTTKIAALEKTSASDGDPISTNVPALLTAHPELKLNNPADAITPTKPNIPAYLLSASTNDSDYDQRTIKPPALRSVSSSPQVGRPKKVSNLSVPAKPDLEDYSDLVADDDESHLNERIKDLQIQNNLGRKLFHPNDLTKLPTSVSSHSDAVDSQKVQAQSGLGHRRNSRPQSPWPVSPASSRANSIKIDNDAKWRQMRKTLGKYSEDSSTEDYSDLFGKPESDSDAFSLSSNTLQLTTRLSNRSWLGDDEKDEDDPFAEIDEGFDADADLEANLARDQHARMCNYVTELVEALKPESSEKELFQVCEQIDQVLTDMPDTKCQLLNSHGALALIQLLEISTDRELVTRLLGILNLIIFEDAEAQENLCLIGAIPIVLTFTTKKWPHDLRLEAAHFVFAMCSTSNLTLQFVLSCRGLRTLVDLIDEDYNEQKDLVWIGVGCVSSVLELQSPASRNDFCRMLAQEGLLEPLSTALISVIKDHQDPCAEQAQAHILQTFLIYSQSDPYLKKQVATRGVLRRILQTLNMLEPKPLTLMLKIVKNLSMSPSILDEMQNANTIEILTQVLANHFEGPFGTEMSNQVLNTMYNLCRLSRSRQEEAAQAGIIPQLLRVAQTSSPLKQFALPILCDFAHAGKATRKLFWKHRGLYFYLKLLEDPYWQVSALEAILVWLQEETARVEEVLLQPASIDSLLCLFTTSKTNSFENLLEPYIKICRLSSGIAISMARNPSFLKKLIERLNHTKAVVRLNLLRITKMVCDISPDRNALIQQFNLFEIIDRLGKQDGAVLVRELARDILSQRYMDAGPRTVRRTMSETHVGGSPLAAAAAAAIAAINTTQAQPDTYQPANPIRFHGFSSSSELSPMTRKRMLNNPHNVLSESWSMNSSSETTQGTIVTSGNRGKSSVARTYVDSLSSTLPTTNMSASSDITAQLERHRIPSSAQRQGVIRNLVGRFSSQQRKPSSPSLAVSPSTLSSFANSDGTPAFATTLSPPLSSGLNTLTSISSSSSTSSSGGLQSNAFQPNLSLFPRQPSSQRAHQEPLPPLAAPAPLKYRLSGSKQSPQPSIPPLVNSFQQQHTSDQHVEYHVLQHNENESGSVNPTYSSNQQYMDKLSPPLTQSPSALYSSLPTTTNNHSSNNSSYDQDTPPNREQLERTMRPTTRRPITKVTHHSSFPSSKPHQ